MPYVEWLRETLSDRDLAIVASVYRLHLISGLQLERLHFFELAGGSRSVMRWRVLKRLTDARVLVPLARRVGTARGGSAKICYALDSAGQQLVRLQSNLVGRAGRLRRMRVPGERFVRHALAVSELYVCLVERSRRGQFRLVAFEVEPSWPDGLGSWLRPDALIELRSGQTTDYWWYEADLASESLPTVRAKMGSYLDFLERGQLGPDGVVPRVLIGVPSEGRRQAVHHLVGRLPQRADAMFVVALLDQVPDILVKELQSDGSSADSAASSAQNS